MVYVILRIIFFYILYLFVKSMLKSFVVKKVRKGFENMQGESFGKPEQAKKSQQGGDVIEAEYRKR